MIAEMLKTISRYNRTCLGVNFPEMWLKSLYIANISIKLQVNVIALRSFDGSKWGLDGGFE